MPYRKTHSATVFEGKVFKVRVDEILKPSGETTRVDVVEHGGAVVIVPMDPQGRIFFVDQYRYPIEARLLELPAGTLDANEDPQECAIRECREEIGMSPGRLLHLGGFYLAPGYSTEHLHLYLADDLSPAALERDEDEDIIIRILSMEQVRQGLQAGLFQDGKTLAGLLLAFRHLGHPC